RLDTGPRDPPQQRPPPQPQSRQIQVDAGTNVLSLSRGGGRDRLRYFVFSPPLDSEEPATGFSGQVGRSGFTRRGPSQLGRYEELPEPERLKRLSALAQSLTVPERLSGEGSTTKKMALTLESHLRDSGEYTYSLSMAVDDPAIDPVEDFLFNRKRGHCEYFASALALMLRSVQIPSRLVTGFKGAEFNASDKSYEVQQRHAHAWVEAWVDNEWMTLDPTPG